MYKKYVVFEGYSRSILSDLQLLRPVMGVLMYCTYRFSLLFCRPRGVEEEVPGHDPHPAPPRPIPQDADHGGAVRRGRTVVPRRGRVRITGSRLRHGRHR